MTRADAEAIRVKCGCCGLCASEPGTGIERGRLVADRQIAHGTRRHPELGTGGLSCMATQRSVEHAGSRHSSNRIVSH